MLTRDSFIWHDVLGYGSYATVYKAQERTSGLYYAIKTISKEKLIFHNKVDIVFHEKNALTSLHHPGIVKCKSTMKDDLCLYFILEYCPHGDLREALNKLTPFSEDIKVRFMAQMLDILSYMHSKKFVYGDMKLENLLIDAQYNLKLCDFGTSQPLKDISATLSNFMSTPSIMPPETVQTGVFGFPGDVWSLGCVYYHLNTYQPLFKADTDYLTLRQIQDFRDLSEHPTLLPLEPLVKDLLDHILQVDPLTRSSCEELKAHDIFSNVVWDTLFTPGPPIFDHGPSEIVD